MKLQRTLTALAKALQPLQNRGLRSSVAAALILHFTLYTLHSPAAEPLCWERTPNRPSPAQFDTFHGQSLDFRCTFTGFGALPFGPGAISVSGASAPFLYYQTNGMGAAWWSLPATVSSNVLAATFPPSADPGAERISVFFGAPSNAYAAAQVRFRNSPGPRPNVLPPPDTIDWLSQLTSATNSLSIDLLASLTSATNSLSKSFAPTISNTVTKAYVESIGIASGLTTNDVCNIVTNEVPITSIVSVVQFDYTVEPQISTNIPTSSIISIGYVKNGPIIWEYDAGGYSNYWKVVWKQSPDSATIEYYDPDKSEDAQIIEACESAALDIGVRVTLDRSTRNALGLARLTDIAPTVSNTVTKVYVEDLGIESGISAETATNIATSIATDINDVLKYQLISSEIEVGSASYSDTSESAYSLKNADDVRYANDIFAKLDAATTTNDVHAIIDSTDTTYRRTIGLTNLNQTVQYVNITDATPTTLSISMPTNGVTKDWIVYVSAVTNVAISLPSATWWMADVAYTNDVPPEKPTALWFSQIAEGIFYLGRQSLTEVSP